MPPATPHPKPAPPMRAEPRDARRRREPEADAAPAHETAPRGGRLRRELRYLALLVAFGLVAMPFLIYAAGALTLGRYEAGLGSFLGHLYRDLLRLQPGAWALLGGPCALYWALRLTSRPLRRRRTARRLPLASR